MRTKVCRNCGESKLLEAFARQKGGRDGRHTTCKRCRAAAERSRYERKRMVLLDAMRADPDRRRRQRRIDLRRRYGLTEEERAQLIADQRHRCAICRSECSLVVDHDHRTGAVRGALCVLCNLALGHLQDDPLRAEAIAAYLEDSA